ncbi:MAG TPA: HAD hydrolase family protein [Sphaerochaeta sp.]|nr:HAD hydrolase family protein [Spirochaetota bacterium]HOE84869.1 HAD hydrolase family protein [Sphaerochaeta sp.]HOQ94870.1 HAD hydrolase family protein [Sphaerochaeta sp.]HPK47312.1 HAD hydrolase family protein [Sphaerochaeta sp.]HPY10913.1 HAD hydrolase family protein [Sphaerochaeta sp.]
MYKGIFFCDVDGTILPHGDEAVSPRILSLVREATDRGYLFCISSGRIISTLAPLFEEVEDLVVLSACNGCMIIHHGTDLIPNHTIEERHLGPLSSSLLRWGAIPLLSATSGLYMPSGLDHSTKSLRYALKDVTRFYREVEEIEGEVLQFTGLCSGNLEAVIDNCRSAWDAFYRITITGEQMFDICPTDKGESLTLVREHFAVERRWTWAFGDNENDIAMLEAAGAGYLMDGAHADLHDGRFVRCTDLVATIKAIMDRA